MEYRTTIHQLQIIREKIEQYVINSPEFVSPQEIETFVRIDSFTASSIDIMLYCFTHTTEWSEWLKVKEDLAIQVKQIVESTGAGFAFPSQSLYIEKLSFERPEIFVPPKNL